MKKLNFIILVLIQLGALLFTACGRMGPVPPADKRPPVVNTTSPLDGTTDFPVTGTITIAFSKQMDPSSIDASTIFVTSDIGAPVAGSFNTTDTVSVITPSQPLNEHTTYKVTVSTGVKDSNGIAMTSDIFFSFTTLSFPPPKVVDIQPVNRAKNVGLNTAISIQFSEPMDPSSITGTNIKVSYANGDFSGSVSYNEALGAATFYPDIRFASNTTYAVTVTTGVTDLGKTPLTDAFVSSIKTGVVNDSTAPTVLSTYPSNTTNISVNTPISVTFSEPMDLSTITPSNFIVSQGTATIPGDIKNYGNTVVFTPTNPLAYLTPYTATITMGATDLAGIPLVNNNNTWQFTTGLQSPDTVQPSVLATWPTSTQNNVPVYRQVVALFSESMLASSITPTTFVLVDQNDPNKVPVPGQVKTSGAAAIFIPSQNLAYNTTYTAMIISTTTLGATDLAGNSLRNGNSPAGYTWNFMTEAPASFTITATAGPNGSISPAGSVAVNINNSQTFTITPATGYYINDVLVDGNSVGAVSSYTFSGVTDDHTISASFAINTFTITTSVATSGTGTVTPVNPSVNYGASQTLTFLPATGYHVSAVTIDSIPLSAPLPSSYTFSNVTANHTIVVSFAINTYTVTPSVVGGNGTISPNTAQMVNYNGTTSFTLTPAGGYNIVTPVGGTCLGTLSGNTYTTNPITGNCTVIASYAANIYALTVTKGGTGTGNVTANTGTLAWTGNIGTATYPYGTPVTLTASPDPSSTFTSWTGCDSVNGSQCTVNINAVRNVTVTFTIRTFTITPSVGASQDGNIHGSISPNTVQTVNYGASPTFTITPNTGYYISLVTVDGSPVVGLPNSYTFTNVQGNHTIAAVFEIGTYTITVTAGSGGTITPGTILLPYGGNQKFTIQANPGYSLVDVLVDNVSIGPQTSYTFTNVKDNHTISASFAIIINFTSGGNGTLTGTTSQIVNSGGSTSAVTAVPATGYHFVNWTGTGGFVTTAANPLTVTNVTVPQNITANFAINTYTINFASGGNGTLTGTTSQTVNYGGSATAVTAVPATGYHFVNWTGDGGFVTTAANPLTVTNVAAAQNITANFAINTYTINFASGGNGTLTGTTSQTVNYLGSTSAVTAVPATGYSFVNWTGDNGFVTTAANPLTVTNVAAAQNITANFAINTYTINFASGGNGTLTGTTSQTVSSGGSTSAVTAVPATGYHFVNWTGTGGFVTTAANPLTVTNVTAAQNITANFAINTYTINFASGGNGTLTGTTSQTVNYLGSTSAVTAVPATGYSFVNWTGDNGFVTTAANPLTVTNVAAAQNITANFAINTYTINFASGGNGTLTGTTSQTVNYLGSTSAVTAVPATGYHFVNWTGTGGFVTTAANPLTVTNVTAAQNITANFAINTYTINFASGGNGTLTGTTSQTVNYLGSTSAVTAVPATGYHFVNWTGDNGFVTTAANPLTVTNVAAAQNITANFAVTTYTITTTPGAGGTITPANPMVNYGDSPTFTISPDIGFTIQDVVVDGVSQGPVTSFQFMIVTSNHIISASFF